MPELQRRRRRSPSSFARILKFFHLSIPLRHLHHCSRAAQRTQNMSQCRSPLKRIQATTSRTTQAPCSSRYGGSVLQNSTHILLGPQLRGYTGGALAAESTSFTRFGPMATAAGNPRSWQDQPNPITLPNRRGVAVAEANPCQGTRPNYHSAHETDPPFQGPPWGIVISHQPLSFVSRPDDPMSPCLRRPLPRPWGEHVHSVPGSGTGRVWFLVGRSIS